MKNKNFSDLLTQLWEQARVASGVDLDCIIETIEELRLSGDLNGNDRNRNLSQ